MNTEAEKTVREMLLPLADVKYKEFNTSLLATVGKDRVIGVRNPDMRQIAKAFFKSEYKDAFLASLPHETYEENMVHGFLIELEKDRDRVFELLEEFLPYVDNWATCDSVNPKIFKKNPPDIETIRRWMASKHTYTCRYGIGMLMGYYLDERFKEEYLDDVIAVKSDEYYVNMMRAWFFATALAKQYESTLPCFEKHRLDAWTNNKAIQKARESFRVTQEHKDYLNTLKV